MNLLHPLLSFLRVLLSAAPQAISPPACAACDAPLSAGEGFCLACRASIETLTSSHPPLPDHPALLLAYAVYGTALARAVRRLKYNSRPDIAHALGPLLRSLTKNIPTPPDLVVPVPLHPQRLVKRGYNQAALLAAHVADELHVPLAARALTRRRHTPQQAHLTRQQRQQNVNAAFVATSIVRGRAIVLVDDVVTTGATLAACTRALLDAGATSVISLVVARALKNASDTEQSTVHDPKDLKTSPYAQKDACRQNPTTPTLVTNTHDQDASSIA